MKSQKFILMLLLFVAFTFTMASCAATVAYSGEPKDIPILQKWSGDYPIVHLKWLPEGQQKSRIGYIGDAAIFATVWKAFKPGEKTPEVDFSRNFIVFSRNVDFYNRTSIFKITLKDGVIKILAMETRSALPIEDKVAMAMAVIPRAGVESIQVGNEQIPVARAPLFSKKTIQPIGRNLVMHWKYRFFLNDQSFSQIQSLRPKWSLSKKNMGRSKYDVPL
jgi:hypothetical protein